MTVRKNSDTSFIFRSFSSLGQVGATLSLFLASVHTYWLKLTSSLSSLMSLNLPVELTVKHAVDKLSSDWTSNVITHTTARGL